MIETYDKLTSGRLVQKIVFNSGAVLVSPEGATVAFADDSQLANMWIVFDDSGIWLVSNANVFTRDGHQGMQGIEDPLATIADVVLVDERR